MFVPGRGYSLSSLTKPHASIACREARGETPHGASQVGVLIKQYEWSSSLSEDETVFPCRPGEQAPSLFPARDITVLKLSITAHMVVY